MQIGEVAKRSGVSTKMIRHYEAIGLIAAGARRNSGYRDYGAADAHELRFIRTARDLGFPLDGVRALLDLWRDRSRKSRDVHDLAARHLAEIEAKLAEMSAMAGTLRTLIAGCHGDSRPQCPILEGLAEPAKFASDRVGQPTLG